MTWKLRRGPLVALLSAIAALASAGPAWAAQFTVNDEQDATDADPTDGRCEAGPPATGRCTLRAAVQQSNARTGADEVLLPRGRYVLTIPGPEEPFAATGDLDVNDDLEIVGEGAPVVDANTSITQDRAFEVNSLGQEGVRVAFSEVGIVGGGAVIGGGILNAGELTLSRTEVAGNSAFVGGGVFTVGTLVVDETTIGGREGDGGNAAFVAGGLLSQTSQRVVLRRSTVSGNASQLFGGGIASAGSDASNLSLTATTVSDNRAGQAGGGIAFAGGLELLNVTLNGNEAPQGASLANFGGGSSPRPSTLREESDRLARVLERALPRGLEPDGPKVAGMPPARQTAKNTIAANPFGGQNCAGAPIESLGNNIEFDAETPPSCDFERFENPLLGALADNGGETDTNALGRGSPAIDAGDDDACPRRDQRGFRRVDGDGNGSVRCDIGAFEFGGMPDPRPEPPEDRPEPPDRPECTITDRPGSNVVEGTPRDDVICAGDGNDVVRAGAGDDIVLGGGGNDVLHGGAGDDRLVGGEGNDSLRGDRGRDRLLGQGGNDLLAARDGVRGNDSGDGGPGANACNRDRGDDLRNCS